jgi:ATP-dependent Zn protease
VEWTYIEGDDPHYLFKAVSEEKTVDLKYPVKLTIENLRKSDYSEAQASVAVHEAGHAVMALVKLQLMPKEVKSRTASIAEGFCYTIMPDIMTKNLFYADIVYSLGGLEAEKLIFGQDNMSNGGGSDLRRATTNAAAMVKTYGMANHMHQISVEGLSPNAIYNKDSNQSAEDWAMNLVETAQKEAQQILQDNKALLLEIAHYLSIYPSIGEEDLREITDKYNIKVRTKDNYYGYKDMIKETMMKMGLAYSEIPTPSV